MWPGAARGRGAAVKVPGGWQLVKAPGRGGAGRGGGGAEAGRWPASAGRGHVWALRSPRSPKRPRAAVPGLHTPRKRPSRFRPKISSSHLRAELTLKRTPPSAGCQPPPPRPVRASRVEGRGRRYKQTHRRLRPHHPVRKGRCPLSPAPASLAATMASPKLLHPTQVPTCADAAPKPAISKTNIEIDGLRSPRLARLAS